MFIPDSLDMRSLSETKFFGAISRSTHDVKQQTASSADMIVFFIVFELRFTMKSD